MRSVAVSILVLLPVAVLAAAAPEESGKAVLGTKRGKVYHTHTKTCGSARRIGEANRVWFKSIEDAKKAGRRLCKRCEVLDRKAEEAEEAAKQARKASERSESRKKAGEEPPRRGPTSRPADVTAPAAVLPELARITAVLTGGTLVLDNGDKATLLGVVCPASGQDRAKATVTWLREQTDGLTLELARDSLPCSVRRRDSFGRLLVYVSLGPKGRDLGAELLRKGYGWLDRSAQFQRRSAYVLREREAWRRGWGIWKRRTGPSGQMEVVTGRHAWAYHPPGCPHLQHLVGLLRMTLNEAKERRLVPCSQYRVSVARGKGNLGK